MRIQFSLMRWGERAAPNLCKPHKLVRTVDFGETDKRAETYLRCTSLMRVIHATKASTVTPDSNMIKPVLDDRNVLALDAYPPTE